MAVVGTHLPFSLIDPREISATRSTLHPECVVASAVRQAGEILPFPDASQLLEPEEAFSGEEGETVVSKQHKQLTMAARSSISDLVGRRVVGER